MRIIKSGKVNIVPVPNVPTSVSVVFDEPFEGTPEISVTANTSGPGTAVKGASFKLPTADGFDVVVTRTDTTGTALYWIATREESYDGKKWFDYCVVDGVWHDGFTTDQIPYSEWETDVYTRELTFWEDEYHVEKTVFVTDADVAKFKKLATGTTITYNAAQFVPVTVYDESQMQVFNSGFGDVTSKFDFVGANDIKLYLTPTTGGQNGGIYQKQLLKVEYIEVNYDMASGKTKKVYRGDGVSSFGYVNTFAKENHGVYGTFFLPNHG